MTDFSGAICHSQRRLTPNAKQELFFVLRIGQWISNTTRNIPSDHAFYVFSFILLNFQVLEEVRCPQLSITARGDLPLMQSKKFFAFLLFVLG
jgi:hypothetical protein